jgi:hypothetical protein
MDKFLYAVNDNSFGRDWFVGLGNGCNDALLFNFDEKLIGVIDSYDCLASEGAKDG